MSAVTHTPRRSQDAPTGRPAGGLFDPAQLVRSLPDALRKLDPRIMVKSPVMFVVLVGSVLTTVLAALDPTDGFGWAITAWLWLTTLFANLAEAVAEGRGKAQADTLRKARTGTVARRVVGPDEERVPGTELRVGDLVVCEAGDLVPGDGDVVEGVASVDESAITGESAPVIRESGGDRSAVTGGTKVLSDRIVVKITTRPGETFIDRMIGLVEGAARQKTPNEIALNILLASLTVVFLLAVVTLQPFAAYAGRQQSMTVLTALLVCLIPTTIGALLSAIGIAGMDRLVQRNVLAMSGRAVEAAGDVSTLLLDKTGTITVGSRQAAEFLPVKGVTEAELAAAARLSSLADETPEGRSVVALAEELHGPRVRDEGELSGATWVEFTAQTRMSGVDLPGRRVRKGAAGSVLAWVTGQGGAVPADAGVLTGLIAEAGGTPLLVAVQDGTGARVLGVIHLKDVVKPGMRERFAELRRMGIRTVMITGDNPLTAKAIADEAGVDDFLAEATPEDKMALIRREQAGGRLVAMTGDGTNDAPALAQADVGVAMNTGTSAAKEAGNMVDLDSDPTKLIEIVAIGKQLLITRGALTTFSIANDVAKYFAIIPAMFAVVYPGLDKLNIMDLSSPRTAILSAVIFNALIIVALVPLALRGVRYRPAGADRMLRRNLTVYGIGGLVAPFIGIKLIDLVLSLVPGLR
ncbi:potassium-transporting ATPase subunit KdpB [Streptomyces sp. NE06-03E]|uniref:potassium-transporting ATPase subunit KdpB n=1 Tax=unclassified Streptomyces TaxID=2593676 RepID=UPI000F558C26|nr:MULTISPECIES: potassium-transporting ATPase subunit KdpB [unclassified Streptomyces]WSS71709.1 potassium-transporting ATPase subunit KdpB [Streptomyces sp. NBC_01175]WSS78715.1 potassium-transporting ATPase subunit KdpB [Streptomyces sp. NBC_01174]MDX3054358.1 potassium-transporting ATPase subunit KdpB [Streptomyces sp. NE06-03E]MDX3430656.1 potassium-transporting ATPase subunit KdpB [Streptomyces sp. ME01-18a]MDX3683503.1 potassium-transporting ATPase subunit KdpB [Streptomyces sp. AK04-4c